MKYIGNKSRIAKVFLVATLFAMVFLMACTKRTDRAVDNSETYVCESNQFLTITLYENGHFSINNLISSTLYPNSERDIYSWEEDELILTLVAGDKLVFVRTGDKLAFKEELSSRENSLYVNEIKDGMIFVKKD